MEGGQLKEGATNYRGGAIHRGRYHTFREAPDLEKGRYH